MPDKNQEAQRQFEDHAKNANASDVVKIDAKLSGMYPALQDWSITTRAAKASALGSFGLTLGNIADRIIQRKRNIVTRKGIILGGSAGALLGAFSPEFINWAAYQALDDATRDEVDDRIRQHCVDVELQEQLRYFGLTGRGPEAEFHTAYRRLALHFHSDRNPSADAHVQMVALNAMRDGVHGAYKCKKLPRFNC